MNMVLRTALDRTLLLMRDDVRDAADDLRLLQALTGTVVALVGNRQNLTSHSAQTAFVTTAQLLARSGHQVQLFAPDDEMRFAQPPLGRRQLVSALVDCGHDLMPGCTFHVEPPARNIDLCIVFGDSQPIVPARRTIFVHASDWSARLTPIGERWPRSTDNPFGGLAVAGLSAAEAFKVAMMKVRRYCRDAAWFLEQFKPTETTSIDLAPSTTPLTRNLEAFDLVSAGAISHSVLYALARIPGVRGYGRVFDDDKYAATNLNRYMLLLRQFLAQRKVTHLADLNLGGFRLDPIPARFHSKAHYVHPLAPRMLVGVDHIPSRWEAQMLSPQWLGIGATTHWSAMASFHDPQGACAGCLHPYDDRDERDIPTVAFVSFWAGLLLTVYFLCELGGMSDVHRERQSFLTPFRPEALWRSPVAQHPACPVHYRRAA